MPGVQPQKIRRRVRFLAACLADAGAFGPRHRLQRRHLAADLVDVRDTVQAGQDLVDRVPRTGLIPGGHLHAHFEDAQLQLVGAVRVELFARELAGFGGLPERRATPLIREQLACPGKVTLLSGQ